MQLDDFQRLVRATKTEIAKAVQGQDAVIDLLLTALFARGHCLLEGAPGTAKTLLAQSLAASLALKFGRVQFTPDLMPGDVLGVTIFDFRTNQFTLTKGPIFTEILLADEINRAPPKTQSALLQAMNEREVTLDGKDFPLSAQFFVIATQNPIEQQGTYPLPEAQLDRFLFKLQLEFPEREAEIAILTRHSQQPLDHKARSARLQPVLSAADLAAATALIDSIRLEPAILHYIVDLIRATRQDPDLRHGASTRAADALAGAVRTRAAMAGRDYAIPDDVQSLLIPTLRHRVVLGPTAEIEGRSTDQVLRALLNRIDAPR